MDWAQKEEDNMKKKTLTLLPLNLQFFAEDSGSDGHQVLLRTETKLGLPMMMVEMVTKTEPEEMMARKRPLMTS